MDVHHIAVLPDPSQQAADLPGAVRAFLQRQGLVILGTQGLKIRIPVLGPVPGLHKVLFIFPQELYRPVRAEQGILPLQIFHIRICFEQFFPGRQGFCFLLQGSKGILGRGQLPSAGLQSCLCFSDCLGTDLLILLLLTG